MYKDNIVSSSMTSDKKISNLFNYISDTYNDIPNILIYGPNEDENYNTFMRCMDNFSQPNIIKRLRINMLSGSDISIKKGNLHFEIDMGMIGNMKIWMELYDHIRDIIIAKKMSKSVLLLKNFHMISIDILEPFYSMVEDSCDIKISFIILTRDITFINETIRKRFIMIRPKTTNGVVIHNSHKIICDNIVRFIVKLDNITYQDIRSNVYQILTHNLNQIDCVTYILDELIRGKHISITRNFMDKITEHINGINKNYRSIYHLEGLFVYLIINVHGL